MLDYIINNWQTILVAVIILAVAGFAIYKFTTLTKAQQTNKIKSWLIWAVSEAEQYLGSGTGALKLRYVYNLFVTKFAFISCFISFEMFSAWVDEALVQMREMIDKNENIADILKPVEVEIKKIEQPVEAEKNKEAK